MDKNKIEESVIDLIKGRLITIKSELQSIDREIADFILKYNMNSEEFLSKFDNGLLGDDEDFFTWKGKIKIKQALINEQELLRETL
ncbi:MAG: hypothetical protein ACTSRU_12845 [Candidatus Hodarchaeales archaeon]